MNGVFHVVLSRHFVLVTLHVFVIVRIGEGDFDRAPKLAARNGIGSLVSLIAGTERRQTKSKREDSHNRRSSPTKHIASLRELRREKCRHSTASPTRNGR